MRRRRYVAQRRLPTRRWHIPPPLIHGSDTLEGGSILLDWDSDLGVLLWQASRDVMLWATTEVERRSDLFATPAGLLPESEIVPSDERIRRGLHTIASMVADPVSVRDDEVARGCRGISEWAQENGKLNTALAFAQNAALVSRSSPAAAFWVATLAGRLNDHARAEGWFRRAVGLARQSRDWRMYARSFSGLGNLYIRRGNLPAARRLHTRALRGARRGGMKREQAYALHDLFVVAVELGNGAEAERFARQALEAGGTRNDRIHALAHDVAYFWMEQGHFRRALDVFQATLPLIELPLERTFVLANVARAAGGAGDARTVGQAADEVERMLARPDSGSATARALLEVARGFLSLGDYERAEEAARRALASAVELRENKTRFVLEALLESINERASRRQLEETAASPQPWSPGDELAADFVRTLKTIAGAA